MGSGKSILLLLRVLAPLIGLGLTGLAVWSRLIIVDARERQNVIFGNIASNPQAMALWKDFFKAILGGNRKILAAIGSTAAASFLGIVLVLATILLRMRVPYKVLIPMEFLCMCGMGIAFGLSLWFAVRLNAVTKVNLDTGDTVELERFLMLVKYSLGYVIAAGVAWVMYLVTFIMGILKARGHAQDNNRSCSFEPTASGLGINHSYTAEYHGASVYDPEMALNLNEANVAAWTDAQARESVGKDVGVQRVDTIESEKARMSFGSDYGTTVSLNVQKPEPAKVNRPMRPWSVAHSNKGDEVGHAM